MRKKILRGFTLFVLLATLFVIPSLLTDAAPNWEYHYEVTYHLYNSRTGEFCSSYTMKWTESGSTPEHLIEHSQGRPYDHAPDYTGIVKRTEKIYARNC